MPIDTGQQWVLAGRTSELGAAGEVLGKGTGVLLTGGSGWAGPGCSPRC